jgi:hypothetical protein
MALQFELGMNVNSLYKNLIVKLYLCARACVRAWCVCVRLQRALQEGNARRGGAKMSAQGALGLGMGMAGTVTPRGARADTHHT